MGITEPNLEWIIYWDGIILIIPWQLRISIKHVCQMIWKRLLRSLNRPGKCWKKKYFYLINIRTENENEYNTRTYTPTSNVQAWFYNNVCCTFPEYSIIPNRNVVIRSLWIKINKYIISSIGPPHGAYTSLWQFNL